MYLNCPPTRFDVLKRVSTATSTSRNECFCTGLKFACPITKRKNCICPDGDSTKEINVILIELKLL